jgi:urocanate hydratase
MSDGLKTGVFKAADKDSVVVIWRGNVVARYENTEAFIAAHMEALNALDIEQEKTLQDEYTDL